MLVNWNQSDPRKSTYWLDERRIIQGSYPFVMIKFGPYDGKNEEIIFTVSTDFTDYDNNIDGTGMEEHETEWSAAITSARIEGECPTVRKAIVGLIDPSGILAESLTKIGITMNDSLHVGQPNVQMVFGWRGLKPDNEGITQLSSSLTGLIMKAAQDISPEGVFSVELDILEYSAAKIDITRFLSRYDMLNGLPVELQKKMNNGNKKVKPQTVLNYVLSEEGGFSVGKAMKYAKIIFKFLGEEKTKEIPIEQLPKIRFGDHLESYIEDIIAMVSPENHYRKDVEKKGRVLAYKKGSPMFNAPAYTNLGDGTTVIEYNWEEIMDPTAEPEIDDGNEAVITKPDRDNVRGPSLVWRKQDTWTADGGSGVGAEGDFKTLISWQSDLSSHNTLIHMMNAQMDKALEPISDQDWENILTLIEKKGLDRTKKVVERKYNNIRDISEAAEGSGGQVAGLNARDQETYRAMKLFEMLDEYEEKTTNNASTDEKGEDSATDKLRAVIMMNAFRSTAIIMGDPTLGTVYEAVETVMSTYFDNTNVADFNLSSVIFDRLWTMFKTTHIFEEGNYTTEIQLIGMPEVAPSDIKYDGKGNVSGL